MATTERLLEEILQAPGQLGRPAVTLSYAQSLDGSLAARRGVPLPLSGPQASRLTHRLRAAHHAILVGIGTVLADDPRLTVRLAQGEHPQPVVLDGRLRFPLQACLLQGPRPPWIAATEGASPQKAAALEAAGAQVLRLPPGPDGRVDLPALLALLAGRGVARLMVEGGATVIGSFLASRLVDRVVLTVAPLFVGGLPAVESRPEPETAPALPRLAGLQCERLGEDLVLWGWPQWPSGTGPKPPSP